MATETVTVGETNARAVTTSRPLATETVASSESLNRQFIGSRPLSPETVTISETQASLKTLVRILATETVAVGESLLRLISLNRPIATQTTAISETQTRLYSANRIIPTETTTIAENQSILKGFSRTLATETTTISETLARVFNGARLIPTETVAVTAGTLARVYSAIRSLSDTTVVSETLARLATNIRALATETVVITSGTLARMLGASRQIAAETVAVSETIARLFTGQRLIATQTTTISDSVATLYTPAPPAGTFERQMPLENVAITESLNRVVTNARALLNPIALSFDGVNDYLNCGNDASLWSGTLTKFSFSLWLYNDTSITTSALILDHNSNNAQSFVVYNSTVGSAITFRIVKNDLTQINCTASGLSNIINRWVHLVGTYDSTLGTQNVKFYIDSVRTGNQPNVNETLTSSGILTLSGAITDHKGYMRDFKFWNNQALSQTEVNNVFSDNPVAPSPNYWLKMDEGTGNPTDAITGTKTATLTNGTTWLTNPDYVAITESVSAQKGTVRTIPTQTTAITESLVRAYGSARALPAEVVNVVDLSLSRLYSATRAIPAETVPITETVSRAYSTVRALAPENVSISDSVATLITTGANAFVRVLVETISIAESLARVFNGSRELVETITISDHLEIPAAPVPTPSPLRVGPPKVETVTPKRQRRIAKDLQPYPEPRPPHARTSDKDEGQVPETSMLNMMNGPVKNFFGNIIGMFRKKRDPDLEL